jgi:PST family polysaccharide transporter
MKSVQQTSDDITRKNTLLRAAGRGGVFNTLGGAASSFIRIAASTILARLLSPNDYGVFGVALLVQEFVSHVGALGMGIGIIAKLNISEKDLNTCFWTMAPMRLLMFAVCFLVAPLAALFFGDDRIDNVLRVTSLTFLFSIIGLVPSLLLKKSLQFLSIVKINFVAAFIQSLVAITMSVFVVQNYWALVIAMLAASAANSTMLFLRCKWIPKLQFDKDSFRFLFRYGANNLGISIVEYLHQNLDYLLVGRVLGPRMLGLYEFAYRIPHLFQQQVAEPLRGIVFPVLSKVQERDDLLISGYVKTVRYVALAVFPALAGLSVVADLAVGLLWGQQWVDIVIPLRILCAAAAVRVVTDALRVIFNCKGRPDVPFKFGLVTLAITFTFVYFLGKHYGIKGVATAMLLSALPSLVLTWFAFRLLSSKFMVFVRGVAPPLVSGMMVALGVTFLRYLLDPLKMNPLLELALCVSGGVVTYLATLLLFYRKLCLDVHETTKIILDSKVANASDA